MKMKDIMGSLQRLSADLGLNAQFIKGQTIPIRNCWHFSTDGNQVEYLFADTDDFIDGMNRIYVVCNLFDIVILAFCLMDNHVHFVLWGNFDDCNRFMHEYIRRTSMRIARKYDDRHKLKDIHINYQKVDTDLYLKTVICYVIKNPSQAGLPYTAYDYPWSSGALYMRKPLPAGNVAEPANWTAPQWLFPEKTFIRNESMSTRRTKSVFKTNDAVNPQSLLVGNMVFPGEYVAYEIVNRIFRTHKSFNFFMCVSKEKDVESRGGAISRLSIPNQEMRQNKAMVCKELFGVETVRTLSTEQRLRLVKTLRSRYDSSPKQLVKMCGLVYDEVKSLL